MLAGKASLPQRASHTRARHFRTTQPAPKPTPIVAKRAFGRYLEVRAGNPMKPDGDPATPADFRRYLLMVAVIGPLLWIVANVVGNHVLAG
jgi:hypothetical protein